MKTSAELLTPEVLTPGWYENVPEHIYHTGPAWRDLCSNSQLTAIHNSAPARARYDYENQKEVDYSKPVDSKNSLAVGTATHFAILQPELFDTQYFRCPDDLNLTRNADKAAMAELYQLHAGKIALRADVYDQCKSMAAAVFANMDARIFLESAGDVEVSGVWDDEETGLRCKLRIDKLSEEFRTTVDAKTCKSAHPRDFEIEIFKRGYHRQGAMYVDGANALGSKVEDHVIIAVEKKAPHLTVVYRLKRDALDLGRAQLKTLKQTYKQCRDSGVWPGYPEGLVWIGVPTWAHNIRETDDE